MRQRSLPSICTATHAFQSTYGSMAEGNAAILVRRHARPFILSIVLWLAQNTGAGAAEPAWGVHGMVLFDQQAQLASHLPLYQHPHNYQVILALQWDEPIAEQLASWRQRGESITVVPQAFDLEQLNPTHPHMLGDLHMDFYRGHFERGGQRQWQDVPVRIAAVLHFSQINQVQASAADGERCFYPLSWQGNHYLLGQIRTRPAEDVLILLNHPPAHHNTEAFCVAASQYTLQGEHFSLSDVWYEDASNMPDAGANALQGTLIYREVEDLQ